jgi:cyclic dehypoxanthinyl futalosine synthase
VSPLKTRAAQYLEIHEEFHKLGMTSTATMMFGMGESWADRVEHLDKVRALQDRSGGRTPRYEPKGFTAFIPWTFQTDGSTRLKHPVAPADEYLRVIALSRLYLDNFAHIQAGWVTEGPRIAQVALGAGADDWGGVLMEENVISASGTLFGMTPPHARRYIRELGFVPAQRDTYYKVLRRFDEPTDEEHALADPQRLNVHLGRVGNRGRGELVSLKLTTREAGSSDGGSGNVPSSPVALRSSLGRPGAENPE